MHIQFVDFARGALNARGIAVVIDVFRASSVQAYALSRGAERIIPVAEIDEARELKRLNPDWWLIGEREAKPLPGFDGGNSPTEILTAPIACKTVIHTTHSGTQSLTSASRADAVFSCGLVNLSATARRVRAMEPEAVTIVRSGHQNRERCEEDDLCAEWLALALRGQAIPTSGIARDRLRASPAAAKFFDPACDWAPARDFELATQVDALDTVVQLVPGRGLEAAS